MWFKKKKVSNSMAKSNETDNKLPNMIGSGTKIIGNVETNGDIRIDGEVEGNIISKGKVVIGSKGKIIGEVQCVNAELSGLIQGVIKVSELLSLKNASKLLGDIFTSKLSIEPGATFTGSCKMGDVNQPKTEIKEKG